LGVELGIGLNIIGNIENDHQGAQSRLLHVLQHWLDNDPEASWNKLANALEFCNYRVLADFIRKRQTSNDAYALCNRYVLNSMLYLQIIFIKDYHPSFLIRRSNLLCVTHPLFSN